MQSRSLFRHVCVLLALLMILSGLSCENSDDDAGVGFLAVHLEPGSDPSSSDYAATYWGAVQLLVADADTYGHQLTLLFCPPFATWVGQDPTRLSLVKSWQSHGHEVGIHHHGPNHTFWDGYTDSTNHINDDQYLGSFSVEGVSAVTKLTRDGRLWTATVGPTEDADTEWPEDVPYEADGGRGGVNDLVSEPASGVRDGQNITSLRHAQYGVGIYDVSLTDIELAATALSPGQVLGLTFHDQNYAENPALYQDLFRRLKDWSVPIRTVRSILGRSRLTPSDS